MLEETKQRQRLQQEARTIAKLEQLEIEICAKLSGELECSNTDTARQYTVRLTRGRPRRRTRQFIYYQVGVLDFRLSLL